MQVSAGRHAEALAVVNEERLDCALRQHPRPSRHFEEQLNVLLIEGRPIIAKRREQVCPRLRALWSIDIRVLGGGRAWLTIADETPSVFSHLLQRGGDLVIRKVLEHLA